MKSYTRDELEAAAHSLRCMSDPRLICDEADRLRSPKPVFVRNGDPVFLKAFQGMGFRKVVGRDTTNVLNIVVQEGLYYWTSERATTRVTPNGAPINGMYL